MNKSVLIDLRQAIKGAISNKAYRCIKKAGSFENYVYPAAYYSLIPSS